MWIPKAWEKCRPCGLVCCDPLCSKGAEHQLGSRAELAAQTLGLLLVVWKQNIEKIRGVNSPRRGWRRPGCGAVPFLLWELSVDNPQRRKKGPGLRVSAVPGQQLAGVDDFTAVSFCFSLPERAGAPRGQQQHSWSSTLCSASGLRLLHSLWCLLTSSEWPKHVTGWLRRALKDSAASLQVEEDLWGLVSAQRPEGHLGP